MPLQLHSSRLLAALDNDSFDERERATAVTPLHDRDLVLAWCRRDGTCDLRAERLSHRPEGLASALRHLGTGAQPSYWDDLPRLTIPVRLIAGVRDEKFAALARRMAEKLPKGDLRLIENAGHAPHLEQPQAFQEAVR